MEIFNYRVRTGNLDVYVDAENHTEAVIKAINDNNPKRLGLLVSVWKKGDDISEEVFMKSEFVLNKMGFLVER